MNSTIPNNDEIDLRTLVLMLRRQFKLLMIITVVVTVLGSAWSLTRPQQYRYYQAIRLAHYTVAGKQQLLQPTTEIKKLIEQIYLPAFQQVYQQQHPDTVLWLQNHYTITANKGSRNLYFNAEGENHFKEVFVAANHYLFKKISQRQQEHSAILIRSINGRIRILGQAIPKLDKLKEVGKIYIVSGKNSQETMTTANNYIASLIAYQNQSKLIQLKMQLTDLQYQKSMIPATLGPVIQTIKPHQLSPTMKILLSFFAGLLLGVITVFLRESLCDDA